VRVLEFAIDATAPMVWEESPCGNKKIERLKYIKIVMNINFI
jgi:hypothetical protein